MKFSKLIPEATSSSERLLDTIFDITVLVKDNPHNKYKHKSSQPHTKLNKNAIVKNL